MAIYSAVYDSYDQAARTVTDLEAAGVPHGDISLVANKYVSEAYADVSDVDEVSATAKGAGLGAAVGGGAGLLAGVGVSTTLRFIAPPLRRVRRCARPLVWDARAAFRGHHEDGGMIPKIGAPQQPNVAAGAYLASR